MDGNVRRPTVTRRRFLVAAGVIGLPLTQIRSARSSPNTATPDPLKVDSVAPWYSLAVDQQPDRVHHVRSGQVVRVLLDSPWHTSGPNERLGVVMAATAGAGPSTATRWSIDHLGPLSEAPTPVDFPRARDYQSGVDIGGTYYDVAGHEVYYDGDLHLWYSDIEIGPELGYRPYVQLVVARYQPYSVPGAHLGPAVEADQVQLDPTREIVLEPRDGAVEATVTGAAAGNIVTANVEELDGQSWVESGAEVELTELSGDQPLSGWSGFVPLPRSVSELRMAVRDQVGGTLVFDERVPIPGPPPDPPPDPPPEEFEPKTLTPADFAGVGICTLTPEQTQGPYFANLDLVRRDMTEDRVGTPMQFGYRIQDPDCNPIEGLRVAVWHCDARGDYSVFIDGTAPDEAGPGTTFLRAVGFTNADGIVDFISIFPGWYPTRSPHIHAIVAVPGRRLVTTQTYFHYDDLVEMYSQPPYAAHGMPDTLLEDDEFAPDDPVASGVMMDLSPLGPGKLALCQLQVDL